ncbi:FG-GAP-like repeat-containing protein [Pleomorphovibrio marinus]|uniref:FG-GAP-like repeat-containing protein n=1 Tax=Pleomorphovibrio marinus TaxID=2164132 RepID=UPI001E481D0F|nr:FG-GAP-like repeat-containing protein [Pleomorphovibrio marinus]
MRLHTAICHYHCLMAAFAGMVMIFISGCEPSQPTLFKQLSSSQTGITFSNPIQESDTFNIMTEEFIYNGGGVAVGDFNDDGLPDLFFSGNEVPNKLYLNQGNMQFLDITEVAGVAAADKWSTGVTVVDINGDGLMDIYVGAAMKKDSLARANLLFVNQGNNDDGIPVFEEKAADYGIADTGYTMNALFFDYDNDGLLDLYVLNNLLVNFLPGVYREKITDGTAGNNDQLYKNNGDGTFTNVSQDAGIQIEGYGLGVAIADFNMDGWPDIYVSNDYLSNDILYINNQDGTFSNNIREYMRHQAYFSMGVDVGDINNDGLIDLVALDMLAESNFRMKTTISQSNYQNYVNNEVWGFEYQYVRNMLHLNNGPGLPFSEIGHFAGMFQTDWSWSPLLVDVDNDGYRDLLVSNGYPRDVTDKDFTNFRADMGSIASTKMLLDSIPIVKIPNYGFKNNGDLTFSDRSQEWGLGVPSFSNGAVVVDLDGDGDLDYVVNNINQEAFVFENQLNPGTAENRNYLRIKLQGTSHNPQGLGAKVAVRTADGQLHYHEHHVSRGFMSTVEDVLHFGLGEVSEVEELQIFWQEGRWQSIKNPGINQVLTLDVQEAEVRSLTSLPFPFTPEKVTPALIEISESLNLNYLHVERDRIDFNLQRTLPHKLSQFGPALAAGDLNGDGLEDLVVGGAAGYDRQLFIQGADGRFSQAKFPLPEEKITEDMGMLLFDLDNDGDLDLYVVSGSNEYASGHEVYQDRIYENDGEGNFTLLPNALPQHTGSGTVVRGADMDGDGLLDLFVGGRSDQGQYPMPGESRLLKNQGGKLEDVTDKWAPELRNIGMVNDALWTDVDNDGLLDLMLVGEFMTITVFKNEGDGFRKLANTGLEDMTGWWTSITAGDFDGDGDMDYVIGNWGLNNFYKVTEEKPLLMYAKDFDNNQSVDPILFAHFKNQEGKYQPYPVHFWQDLYGQSTLFRKRFQNYKAYGRAGVEEVLTPEERAGALKLTANQLGSVYLENKGDGTFDWKLLPEPAQFAPIYGMVSSDVDGDGHLDVMLVGNDYGNEVFSGRLDALTGLWLKGDGSGEFEAIGSYQSGFAVLGDGKALVELARDKEPPLFIASQNRGKLRVFTSEIANHTAYYDPRPTDKKVIIHLKSGRELHKELYHGSGFLSQSSRQINLPKDTEALTIIDFKGEERKINP